MDEHTRILEEIAAAFDNVPHPGAADRILAWEHPCGHDHKALAKWLSEHSWKELVGVMAQGDPVGFGSLSPMAFHYFLPAVLTWLVQNPQEDLKREVDWLSTITFRLEDPAGLRTRKETYLPLFSNRQKAVVVDCLNYLASRPAYQPDSDWPDRAEEFRRAIKDLWA
jgi:hypothetical protein